MSLSSDGIYYISSLLKLNQVYKPEDMNLNDFKIKDKNELINYIKYIHRDISLSAEIIENILIILKLMKNKKNYQVGQKMNFYINSE